MSPYDQGYAAYNSGAENPYAPSSSEAASWQRGFNAAELDAQDAYDWGDKE